MTDPRYWEGIRTAGVAIDLPGDEWRKRLELIRGLIAIPTS